VSRDRDATGRPRNARPRDALGRPLPYEPDEADESSKPSGDAAGPADLAELEVADFPTLLAGAQRLLEAGRPFEAHELLEAAWKRAPQSQRPLWRALAQLAVGITHTLRHNPAGARAVLTRSAEELDRWASGGAVPPYRIDAPELARAAYRMAVSGTVEPVRLTHP
jgi:uncharacterized protein